MKCLENPHLFSALILVFVTIAIASLVYIGQTEARPQWIRECRIRTGSTAQECAAIYDAAENVP